MLKHAVLMLLFVGGPSFAPVSIADKTVDVERYQQELNDLYDSISKIQDSLKNTQFKRSYVKTDLKKLDKAINVNEKNLAQTRKSIIRLDSRLKAIKAELQNLSKALVAQRKTLAAQLRSAYTMGSQQHIKVLLNQQNPELLTRMNTYFRYLSDARESQITEFMNNIKLKSELESELVDTRKKHKQALENRESQQRRLRAQIIKRNQLLVKLERDIEDQEQTLSTLESNRDRIEGLLSSLGELLADIPPNPTDKKPFATQKGKLPWPVGGKFLAKFGTIKQGDLRWNGVLIKTPTGTPVRAVSHGRVAFSDWLQGFGFISIIDHSDGYMSLYGHNESLFKQAGEWVEAGEVIATSGTSGGHNNPGVYFEIRSKGKPVNPSIWCSRSVKHMSAER